MKLSSVKALALGLVSGLLLAACAAPTPTATPVPTPTPKPVAAMPTPSALLKAKQEAEAKGYIFETSYDDILAKAKAEGKMRALSSHEPQALKTSANAFKAKFPFIDVYIEEITGTEAQQRRLLELKAGAHGDWDVDYAAPDFYSEYIPYAKKFDILGMAKGGVLAIIPEMVDPNHHDLVAVGSTPQVVAYNKNLISPDKVPNTWEDFLKPEFKGRKFIVETRPHCQAILGYGLMGEEWIKDYSKKIAAQQPIWARGQTRALTGMMAGEYALHLCVQYNTSMRAMAQDPTGALQFKILEPFPVKLEEADFVLDKAPRPYAGLLWLEFLVSPEGQAITDKFDPGSASIYSPGSVAGKVIQGKKLALVAWEKYEGLPRWYEIVVEAYGFPKVEVK